jgi:hypothetical protein
MSMTKTGRVTASALVLQSILLVGQTARAGGGPQNVAVVVNPADPDSLEIANVYIELRRIPASNIFYIRWKPDLPRTPAAQFGDRLLHPLLDEIKKRGLSEQIDGVAFSSGYPYVVDCAALFKDKQLPPQAKPFASLTSATYLYHDLLDARLELFSPVSNGYFAPVVDGKTTSRAFAADLETGQGTGMAPTSAKLPYLLATSLGVTYGRGNKPAEIIAALRRSAQADGAKYRGTIYYMKNNNIRSQVRDPGFPAAMQELAALGVKSELLPGVVPLQKADVAGLTTGTTKLHLRNSRSTLLPGAIVDNLTSAAGQFNVAPDAPNPQTPVSEFVRSGAGGASGTIVEPYAIAAKFPSPHIHVHYARGCSLAEAYYQSVASPYQLIIVGDPLCQPWAVAPKVSVEGAAEGAQLKGDVTLKPAAKYPDGRSASRFELYVNGIRRQSIKLGETFLLHTSGMSDGFHELRVIAIDNTPIAVQGSWIATVQVKNGREAIQLSIEPGAVKLGDTIAVQVTTTRNEDAVIFQNGRRLGAVSGGNGKLSIDTKMLGAGRVQLWAQQPGEPPLRSRPLTIEIK